MPLVRGVPTNEEKRAPPKKTLFYRHIGLSSVKMVADRHRHSAFLNNHWWRAF